ncbi:MAG TPA: hypothetical protein VGC06_28765 [Actinomycetes bacterium]
MIMLELARRFPPGAEVGSAWRAGIQAFQAQPAGSPA